jgi:D-sedoheptulose 7-phosphate isomerase
MAAYDAITARPRLRNLEVFTLISLKPRVIVTSPTRAADVEAFLTVVKRTMQELDRSSLAAIVDCLHEARLRGRTVFVMGNGGSASTASHFAADLAKYTIAEGQPRFKVICLNDNIASLSAWTNDNGWGSIFAEQMLALQSAGDVLVGFSVHGGPSTSDATPWSENLVRAMAQAKAGGLSVIGFSGYDGGAMLEMADQCMVVPALVDDLGTPVIESVHVVLHHLLVHQLRARARVIV